MPLKLSKEELYQLSIEEDARTGVKTFVLLAVSLFPIFGVLDYLTQREHLEGLTLIRFMTTFILLIIHLFFRQGKWLKKPFLIANIVVGLSALSITVMCMVLEGAESPYYGGVNLVVLAGVLVLPSNARSMIKTVSIIIGIYVVGVLSAEMNGFENVAMFINNMAFLLATGIIGVSAAHMKDKMRREKYFQQNALEMRDSFISMASHELRTPITSMQLQMDLGLLKLGKSPEEEVRKHIGIAYRHIQNMKRLIDEMLDVSRIQSGKFIIEKQEADLNQIVTGIYTRYFGVEVASGTLAVNISQEQIHGYWDEYKLEQVVLNLISNAMKYGGKKNISLETRSDEHSAMIIVSDSGPGIHPEDQSVVFEKFERAKSTHGGGLGLGLYICKEIVEAHGGKIVLISESGMGATFQVILPRKTVTPEII